MTEFNPGFRPTAKECMQSPVFDSIRNSRFEIEAPYPITQEIFKPGVYDYEGEQDLKYNLNDYKRMFNEEIRLFKRGSSKNQDTSPYQRTRLNPLKQKIFSKSTMQVVSPRSVRNPNLIKSGPLSPKGF